MNPNTLPNVQPVIINTPDGKGRYKTGEEVYFKASATDAEGDDLTYSWDFGDGYTSAQENPSHIYVQSGTYSVSLTVTDARGGERVSTFDVEVAKPASTSNGGLGAGLIAGIVIVALVVIVAIAFMVMRGRGGEPAEAPAPPEEPKPDVPDYLMPDPKPAAPEEPEYPDYSNGIPDEQPGEDKSDDGYLGY